MTKEVQIGGQVIKLRATGNLPIAYRLMFNRDMLQDVDKWREQLRVKQEEAEAAKAAAQSEAPEDIPVEASEAREATPVEASKAPNNILYTMDIVLIARLAYCMAKSAEASIPDSMTAWLDTIEDPNALYILTGTVLQLYNNGFETTVEAKKNLPPQLAP